ncbi:hypothetical protein D9M71_830110 [compost metagenome]
MRTAKRGIGILAGNALADQADQEQVVVGPPGDHVIATLTENFRHGLGVVDDLKLVFLEAGIQCLLEAHRLGGDHMHQRPTLAPREHR